MKKICDLYLIQAYYYQIEKKKDKIYWKFTWVLLPTAVQVYFTIGLVLYLQKLFVLIGYFSKFNFSNSELKFVLISVPIILTFVYFTINYFYLFQNNRYIELLKNYERPKRYIIYYLISFGSLFFMVSYGLFMI